MREIVLGTAGHVDHGKTSLVKALTGIDTDRLKEEKKRGITIDLGFAFLDLPCGHRLGIVDVPGHEKFVKHMVAGVAGIDLVAFVIAADEGIMPQTREHFDICRLLGVERGCIIITKKDMVETDWLELVIEETREFFAGSFLEGAPLVAVSSVTGEGIAEVRQVLDALVAASDFSDSYGPFRLPIDRIFNMKGFGVVVTGTTISGRAKVGEDGVIYPSRIPAKIRGIQVHAQSVEEVEAGKRTAINLQGPDKSMLERGDVLASPDCLVPAFMFDAEFQYLPDSTKKLKNRTRVRIHIGTAEVFGRIVLLSNEQLEPGETAEVQILLEQPAVFWPEDRYVVRSYSPIHTIGGGKIFAASRLKRRRFREENSRAFAIYQKGSREELARLLLEESGLDGMTISELGSRLGVFGKSLDKLLQGPLSTRSMLMFDSVEKRLLADRSYQALKLKLLDMLADFHKNFPLKQGIDKEELRSKLYQGLNHKLFQFTLNDLQKTQDVVQDKSEIRLATHEVSLKEDAQKLRQDMLDLYSEAGLTPPRTAELSTLLADYSPKLINDVLAMLLREGKIVKVDGNLNFDMKELASLQRRMIEYLKANKEIDAQGFKQMTGLTRKFSIPILEYFDKQKITIRVGDKRVLRERQT